MAPHVGLVGRLVGNGLGDSLGDGLVAVVVVSGSRGRVLGGSWVAGRGGVGSRLAHALRGSGRAGAEAVVVVVEAALRVGVLGAVGVGADGVEHLALGWDDGDWWAAGVAEQSVQGTGNGGDIRVGYAKGLGRSADLGNEVSDLVLAETHVLVDTVHAALASVGGEVLGAVLAAAEKGSKELVEVSDEEAGKSVSRC